MATPGTLIIDGNQAAAEIAHLTNEVIAQFAQQQVQRRAIHELEKFF